MSDPPAMRAPAIAAILFVGVVGVLIPGLQPQLLGAMALEGRLSAAQIGLAATVELLAMGLAAGGAGAVLTIARLRPVCIGAALSLAAIDAATPWASGGAIIATRAAAGIPEGVLIWLAIGFIARTANPARWAAIYLLTQTLAQLALAGLLASVVLARGGSAGGFAMLAGISLAPLAVLPWLPRAYPPLDETQAAGDVPSLPGLVALTGVLLYLAFVVGIWVYLEPLGRQAGIGPGPLAYAVPLSLAMQVIGASAAAALAGRVRPLPVVLIATLLDLAILALLGASPSPLAFLALAAGFGFLWLFVLPFQVPLVIAADPSRRAAVLIAGAQLIGSSLGPLAASGLVSDADVRPTLWLGTICVIVSAGLMAAPRFRHP
ncbi:MFS transporter [Sphingomonas koreensis]|nr:MFS transporter [Sphingomonas koreensis]